MGLVAGTVLWAGNAVAAAPENVDFTPREAVDGRVQFPALRTLNLAEEEVALPQHFAGSPVWLVVTLTRRDGFRDIAAWAEVVRGWKEAGVEVKFLCLALTPRVAAPLRALAWGKLRDAVQLEESRRHLAVAFTDVDGFRAALGMGEEPAVQVFVTDGAGQVHWHGVGRPDAGDAAARARAAVEAVAE